MVDMKLENKYIIYICYKHRTVDAVSSKWR